MMPHMFLSLLAEPYPIVMPLHLGTEAANLVPSIDTVMNAPSLVRHGWLARANTLLALIAEDVNSKDISVCFVWFHY
ncbi:hypothetical protein HD806DRAFT_505742 [Xylariaceae sp. AK1471]|nr:hypothetical protein HD806DRAFT_505742 [Xylariaceae sp. AK1471]